MYILDDNMYILHSDMFI